MTDEILKLVQDAVEKDFELETIIENLDKNYAEQYIKVQKERSESFSTAINALAKEKNTRELLTILRFFGDKNVICPFVNESSMLEQDKYKNQTDFFSTVQTNVTELQVEKAEKLFGLATSDKPIPYKFRNRWLERAINILIQLCENNGNEDDGFIWRHEAVKHAWEIYLLISECYLRRGKSILPKGKGIAPPEKKVEAFEKALNWTNKALEKNNKEILIINYKAWILDELFRLGDKSCKTALKDAAETAIKHSSFDSAAPFHFFILSIYCDLKLDLASDEKILEAVIEEDDLNMRSVHLIKAKSALRLLIEKSKDEKDQQIVTEDIFNKIMQTALKEMKKKELYSSSWDELIALLNKIESAEIANWQNWAYNAWKICSKKEEKLGFGLEIRQYWSRLSGLYELAYQGAIGSGKNNDSLKKAAEIIDSIKGRTPLTWGEMDNLFAGCSGNHADVIKEKRKQYFINESQIAMTEFIKRHNSLKQEIARLSGYDKKNTEDIKKPKPLDLEKIPANWAAVHLFVNDIDKCDAIICTNKTCEKNGKPYNWEYFSFNGTDILEKYNIWLERYRADGNRSKDELEELCKIIGTEMKFLFNIAESESLDGIIFIPHGFTHLLPLHAAIYPDTNTCLFQNVFCTYLPAWSLIPDSSLKNKPASGQGHCLRAYAKPEDDETYFKEYFDKLTLKDDNKKDKASKDDFIQLEKNSKTAPPKWLIFLCHGKANEVEPFKSALKLCGFEVSMLEILSSGLDLTGSKIMMSSCETELAAKGKSVVDEHLTVASSFLTKGATLILGSMWEISEFPTREIMEEAFKDKEPLWEIVKKKQVSWLKSMPEYWPNEGEGLAEWNDKKFYYIAPFKIIGYPRITTPNRSGSKV